MFGFIPVLPCQTCLHVGNFALLQNTLHNIVHIVRAESGVHLLLRRLFSVKTVLALVDLELLHHMHHGDTAPKEK